MIRRIASISLIVAVFIVIVHLIPSAGAEINPLLATPLASPISISDHDRLATAEAEIAALQTQVASIISEESDSATPSPTATHVADTNDGAAGAGRVIVGPPDKNPTPTAEPELSDLVYVYSGEANDIGMNAPLFSLGEGHYFGVFTCPEGENSILMLMYGDDDAEVLRPGEQYFDVTERERNVSLFSSCTSAWAIQLYLVGPYDDSNESDEVMPSDSDSEDAVVHDIEITIDLR